MDSWEAKTVPFFGPKKRPWGRHLRRLCRALRDFVGVPERRCTRAQYAQELLSFQADGWRLGHFMAFLWIFIWVLHGLTWYLPMDLFCDILFNPQRWMNHGFYHLSCLSWPSSWHSPGFVWPARPVGRSGAGLASAAVTGPGGGPSLGRVRAQRGQGGLEAGWSDGWILDMDGRFMIFDGLTMVNQLLIYDIQWMDLMVNIDDIWGDNQLLII